MKPTCTRSFAPRKRWWRGRIGGADQNAAGYGFLRHSFRPAYKMRDFTLNPQFAS